MRLAAGSVGAIAGSVVMVACPGPWAAPVHACTRLHRIIMQSVQAPVYTPDARLLAILRCLAEALLCFFASHRLR